MENDDRRQRQRVPLDMTATLTPVEGDERVVDIINISMTGVLVRGTEAALDGIEGGMITIHMASSDDNTLVVSTRFKVVHRRPASEDPSLIDVGIAFDYSL